MPYTSRDEMAASIRTTVTSVRSGDLSPSFVPFPLLTLLLPRGRSTDIPRLVLFDGLKREITDAKMYENLYTTQGGSPPLDILIRTSGVKRLSDFLLYQVRPFLSPLLSLSLSLCGSLLIEVSSMATPFLTETQTAEKTKIYFVDTFWPDFGLLQMVRVLLSYQRELWAEEKGRARLEKEGLKGGGLES